MKKNLEIIKSILNDKEFLKTGIIENKREYIKKYKMTELEIFVIERSLHHLLNINTDDSFKQLLKIR